MATGARRRGLFTRSRRSRRGEAGDGIGRFARHGNPFARAWAARAAGLAGDVEALNRLAGDEDPNVREAALRGLGRVGGDGGGEQYLAALESDDPQLVMTAAGLVAEHLGPAVAPRAAAQATQQAAPRDAPRDAPQATPRPASQGAPQPAVETFVSGLFASLSRFTAARRETERDARVALLDAIGAVGGFSPDDLTPYLADFDPVVADLAAALLTRSTGAVHEAAPERLPRTPPPDAARIAELAESQVVLHMDGLGAIVIELRPDLAATNADRFARLARDGYFDGLTFHRVVPNFVIQGGSPHANEYMGDGPYKPRRDQRPRPLARHRRPVHARAATPATPRSSSTWWTTCAWTSTTRSSARWWKAWKSWTPCARAR